MCCVNWRKGGVENWDLRTNEVLILHPEEQQQRKQPFYGPLIQDNPDELVPETTGHINPRCHHYPSQYLFALDILDLPWLLVGCLTLSLLPVTVWPLAGLQQSHRWEQELSQCPQGFASDALPAATLPISRLGTINEWMNEWMNDVFINVW